MRIRLHKSRSTAFSVSVAVLVSGIATAGAFDVAHLRSKAISAAQNGINRVVANDGSSTSSNIGGADKNSSGSGQSLAIHGNNCFGKNQPSGAGGDQTTGKGDGPGNGNGEARDCSTSSPTPPPGNDKFEVTPKFLNFFDIFISQTSTRKTVNLKFDYDKIGPAPSLDIKPNNQDVFKRVNCTDWNTVGGQSLSKSWTSECTYEFSPNAVGNFEYKDIVTANNISADISMIGTGVMAPCTSNCGGDGGGNTPVVVPSVRPTPTPTTTALTIRLTNLITTYNRQRQGISINSNPAGAVCRITYNGSSALPWNAGSYNVVATCRFGNRTSTTSGVFVIQKAEPPLSWTDPAPITVNDGLSKRELRATSTVPGSYDYKPGFGTKLPEGIQKLSVLFNPTDSRNYNSRQASVNIKVIGKPAPVLNAPGGKFTPILIPFKLSSYRLSSDSLELIRQTITKAKVSEITVSGYAQPSSNKKADQILSMQRAKAVAAQIKKILPKLQIKVQAFGSKINSKCNAQKNKCALVQAS